METRFFKKNALFIFVPEFENAARALIQKLQYLEPYNNYFTLCVPAKKDVDFSSLELMEFLKKYMTRENTNAYLVRTTEDIDWDANEDEWYAKAIVDCVKIFKTHNVPVVYDPSLGQKKFNTLKGFRQHYRHVSSQGFHGGSIAQVAVDGNPSSTALAPQCIELSVKDLHIKIATPLAVDESAKNTYQQALKSEILLRQQKVDPILRSAEQHYSDPTCISEKLANLFHAYATGFSGFGRSNRRLAFSIARELYNNPDWEIEDCFRLIKNKIDHWPHPIDPMGTFQALMFELNTMRQSINIFNVGDLLDDHFQEKYNALDALKDTVKGESRTCLDHLLEEVKILKRDGNKPTAVLLRVVEASTNLIKHPTEESYLRQHKVALEVGKHSWGRILGGLSLCLLGVCLGVGIGLATYFTGGALLLTGPLVIQGLAISATLINVGVTILAGVSAAALITGGGFCLFGKSSIQKQTEGFANLNRPSLSL